MYELIISDIQVKRDRMDSHSFRQATDPTVQISPYVCQSHWKPYHLSWFITPLEPQRCTGLAYNQGRQDIMSLALQSIPVNHIYKLNSPQLTCGAARTGELG